MDLVTDEHIGFNPAAPTILLLDVNACFATIEQQANPILRGKPVAVAAYTTPGGCILTASYEAKRMGVKTGMHVRDGKRICANLIVLPPDPEKYRWVNHKLVSLLQTFAPDVEVASIDEMIIELPVGSPMKSVAQAIKSRIKQEIGEWIKVSIGISTNRYLAKLASSLQKPDGLVEITKENIEMTLEKLKLEDLTGIKEGNAQRLRSFGIPSPLALYRAPISSVRGAFRSIVGHHWWMRLHGWESDSSEKEAPKTIGHSYALGKPYTPCSVSLHQILSQLVAKMGRRLRTGHFTASGIHVSCLFRDSSYWHHGQKLPAPLYADGDLYKAADDILQKAPGRPVRLLAVTSYLLVQNLYEQQTLFDDDQKKQKLMQAIDAICDRWGEHVVMSGRMLSMDQKVLDRIAFGSSR